MDETPFIHYLPQHRDLIICYDYRSLDFDKTLLSTYTQIQVVAWSMGVWAASQVLQGSNLPITQSIAINGTPFPIDDARGIPPIIFEGTLNNLSEATLQKFRRRMCGSGSDFKAFCEIAPQRTVEELKEELAAIRKQCNELPHPPLSGIKRLSENQTISFRPGIRNRRGKGIALKYSDMKEHIMTIRY